ncbi:MAG: 50S ribosomal protein L11 [Candidatus Aenigmarchaeota archaeon]|nr:50S ribosomal protein L11 [Candidatus Aenigmarchaeota archaeon]
MTEKETIELLIEGDKASPGPTTASKLSAYKLNIGEIFKQINERTKEYSGMKVPVKIVVDKRTKEYEIKVGTPPVSSLIKKELGIEVAKITEEEKTAGKTSVGDLKMEKILKIAKLKMENFLAKDLKSAVKLVLGTAASMPITVEGKKAKEIISEVNEGKWDHLFK